MLIIEEMDANVKTELKIEIKTESVDIMTSLKDEAAADNDDEYVVPPKRLRRNQGIVMLRNN